MDVDDWMMRLPLAGVYGRVRLMPPLAAVNFQLSKSGSVLEFRSSRDFVDSFWE